MHVTLKKFVDRSSPQHLERWGVDGHVGPAPASLGDVHHQGVVERRRTRRAARDHHPNAASRCDRLRDLGYPITSTTGRYGGYELGAGGRLPPLLLDDDEAIAVSVAFARLVGRSRPDARRGRTVGLGQTPPGAPAHRCANGSTHSARCSSACVARGPGEGERVELPSLMTFATACRRGERAALHVPRRCRSRDRTPVEPHRLVSLGRRWYLVGFDLDRDDWRTYRIDRVSALIARGTATRRARHPTPLHRSRRVSPCGSSTPVPASR